MTFHRDIIDRGLEHYGVITGTHLRTEVSDMNMTCLRVALMFLTFTAKLRIVPLPASG